MLYALIQCGISNYNNPVVVMQFFEACARYGDFFKVRKECIIPLLDAMVGPKYVCICYNDSVNSDMELLQGYS